MRCLFRRHDAGQALVLVALIMPFLLALLLTAIEVQERFFERAAIEESLKQATRGAVQRFDYAGLAQNSQQIVVERATTNTGCTIAPLPPPGSARATACAIMRSNLAGLRGLEESVDATLDRVRWTTHSAGGSCALPDGTVITSPRPLVCATLAPRLTGLLGWGVWSPQLAAADTLDAGR